MHDSFGSSDRQAEDDDASSEPGADATRPLSLKIVSWNLLHTVGTSIDDVVQLVRREAPDLLLMQEATSQFAALPDRIGGHYAWAPLPGRIHGLAMWSAAAWEQEPVANELPPGTLIERVCQTVEIGGIGLANVHLSHGQRLNRRQLRTIGRLLPPCAAVLGDYNLVGPAMLPGFRDVGPRRHTHRMGKLLPLRLDRCLVRGLTCNEARVLRRERSDHKPIVVRLTLGSKAAERSFVRYREAAAEVRRRAALLAGFGR